MTRKMFLTLMFALLIAPLAAQAQPWAAAPGTGAIDEAALGIYQVDNGKLFYNSTGSINNILARYNVTDTSATGAPSWTTFELRYFDNSPSGSVNAQLVRLSPGGGTISTIAACNSTDSGTLTVLACPLAGATVNFNAGYIYQVVVTLSRSSTSADPWFLGARLY